ncbi:MAG TPA: hypothetical protein VIL74_09020 [Pyrinomonadaceae bacterium]|jgi:hypothetical protein
MDKEILENIYDRETGALALEGDFGLKELQEMVKFLESKEAVVKKK